MLESLLDHRGLKPILNAMTKACFLKMGGFMAVTFRNRSLIRITIGLMAVLCNLPFAQADNISRSDTREIMQRIQESVYQQPLQENYLRLYFFPSYPVSMNWTSPRSLLESSMDGIVSNPNHPISHANVEVHCVNAQTRQTEYHVMAGASSENSNHSARLLLKEKVGFSVLERSWPGAYENLDEIAESFESRIAAKDPISAVTYVISESTCQRLQEYHDRMMANPAPTYYGFSARPRFNEGGGCSAFAASFAEVAGIVDAALYYRWTQMQRVPLKLMAGYGVEKISVMEVQESPHSARWSMDDEPHMLLEVYDPDQMHRWVMDAANDNHRDQNTKSEVMSALQFDVRSIESPDEPIFLGEPDLLSLGRQMWIRNGKSYRADGSFVMRPH